MAKKRLYKVFIYVAGVFSIVACGFLYSCTSKKGETYTIGQHTESEQYEEVTSAGSSDTHTEETCIAETLKTIFVYVCGNVVNPGVYEAYEDSRVYELIDKAGGVTDNGCLEAVNLAEHVYDGQKLYIPDYEEYEDKGSISYQQENSDNRSSMVNINSADAEALMTLPGIGKSRAEAIIDYRNTNGFFTCIEDIMCVGGIKESAFSKIREYICVN